MMTDQEIKSLSDSELMRLIDSKGPNDSTFNQISQLAKTDGEFRSRVYQLKADNKKDSIKSRQELIAALEENLKTATEPMKGHLQSTLDILTGKIQDSDFEEFIDNQNGERY
jgi:DNA-binding GntR family transcriptional regulator